MAKWEMAKWEFSWQIGNNLISKAEWENINTIGLLKKEIEQTSLLFTPHVDLFRLIYHVFSG
jgi:hypothetical protein